MKWLVVVALSAGCYRPGADPACAIACVEGVENNCPPGLDCIVGSCRRDNASCPDDAMLAGDGDPVDTSISQTDAGFCVGSNMPLQVCLAGTPMNSMSILTRTTIDTTNCASLLLHQGQSLCVFAYNALTVAQTLHFIGTHAPVIVANNVTVQPGGRISVVHEMGTNGAGSNPAACPSLSEGSMGVEGAGGGAGGSFGSFGGDGGNGQDNDAIGALHSPASSAPYTSLRGGCAGSMGGSELNLGGFGGAGGSGGGAIAILAADTITINGAVLAYGAGGEGAAGQYGGGGGGGAGGMIVIDAPILAGNGWVGANGGGGGGGGTNMVNGLGGGTSQAATPQAGGTGGSAGTNAGIGGTGGAVGDANGGAPALYGGGGGGGGGGVVLVRGSGGTSLAIDPRR